MFYDLSKVARHHQNNLAASAPPSLIPKRCACGTRITARQLVQHGKCAACLLAIRVATLHAGDIDKLKHALGAVQHRPKRTWGLRNYFCAGSGRQTEAMQRLVAAGFASVGRELEDQTYFHATKDGCKLAGLDAAGIRRALDDRP